MKDSNTVYAGEGEKAVLFENDGRCRYCTMPIERVEDAVLMDTFGAGGGRFLYHGRPCLGLAIVNQKITRGTGIRVPFRERGE